MSDYRDESCIEHMIEAAGKVSKEFRFLYPFVPWRQAIAMRSFVIHDYAGVSPDIMWDTALTVIPKLLAELSEIKSK